MKDLANDQRKNSQNQWDVIVVGGGPAGCSAAMVLARSKRKVLLIDGGKQRNIRSHGLRNFLTRDGIKPPDFLKLAYADLQKYDVTYEEGEIIDSSRNEKGFVLKDDEGREFHARKVLLATGVTDIIPEVEGMEALWGQSVFHCPFCDGFECCEYKIGLYAHLHNGYAMAIALRHISNHVTLYTDGRRYLRKAQREELLKRGIEIVTKKLQRLVHHDLKLEEVELEDGALVPCDFMFVHHHYQVNGTLLNQLTCRLSKAGAAITNRRQETSVPGVYVAGDASHDVHFAVVAAAEGVKAAVSIHNALLHEDNRVALEAAD